MVRLFLLSIALSVALPADSTADSTEDAIAARRRYKQLVQHFARELFAIARGEIPYDREKAALLAGNLKDLTRLNNGILWPVGSHRGANRGKTRALIGAWDLPRIQRHHSAFRAATGNLAKAAGEGLDALQIEAHRLERVCRGCHETYRASDF